MIGLIQKTFNKFHYRNADRTRTYRHYEILLLEIMIIKTIERASQKHSKECNAFPIHTHLGLTKKLIGEKYKK